EPMFDDWLSRVERLAEKAAGAGAAPSWADLVALYRSVVADILDEDKQVHVLLRIADLARTKLGDAALAKQSYQRTLELRPEETQALEALEALHEEAGEHESLFEVLKRRADIAPSDEDKRRILYKQAKVAAGALGDGDRAIQVY